MADLVQIMYGEEGAYGIVSQPKATRTAINVYLDGYLKEENIRFRDKTIKFTSRPPVKKIETESIVSWSQLSTKLDKFTLSANEGKIKQGDVVGVLGENGTGKTSFVRVLAGDLKTENGSVNEDIKVSYKPQYLETNSDDMVMSFLGEKVKKYDVQVMRPLQIPTLLMKKMKELSGGELQRVAIANALAQEVDLFLLDEPSAYLDVEQRLMVSKAIRDYMERTGKSCLIVDHDLLFMDYLSDDLMIFGGTPAIEGISQGPFAMKEGMNMFLTDLNITLRRDEESNRPRINKVDSVKDREQKSKGNLYYT
jgi:ATP-binding cassette subfamily E protein 1